MMMVVPRQVLLMLACRDRAIRNPMAIIVPVVLLVRSMEFDDEVAWCEARALIIAMSLGSLCLFNKKPSLCASLCGAISFSV